MLLCCLQRCSAHLLNISRANEEISASPALRQLNDRRCCFLRRLSDRLKRESKDIAGGTERGGNEREGR
eukprot:758969-Hanusia_phi.AAC.4